MTIERIVRVVRKAVYTLAFLSYLCIPISGGRDWAPMLLIYVGGWQATNLLVISFRVCVTIAAFGIYKLLSGKSRSSGLFTDCWIFGIISLSFLFLIFEAYPTDKFTTVEFIATVLISGLLTICDILTLRWLANRDQIGAEHDRGKVH